ncbi:MAG: hypothetical protein AAF917_12870 [Pseudomonadota bacterium]
MTTATNESTHPTRLGWVAVLLGFVSFAAVVGHFFAGPFDPPPPMEVSIADAAANIRDATVAALKGEEYEAEPAVRERTLDDYLTYAFIGTALLAMFVAVISFLKHEPWRPAFVGVAFGAMAITFQFADTVFFVVMFVLLLSAVIDKLGFDF